ncbi:hypothetical protein [Mongoliibacter ruber]|uniref:hypothetical protein n=1 Tax=Mongoliibacter ruber TaxID=1750599 RepID=UPI0014735F9A|nr:hypothetical protein [Mongoliibacter ruber]
MERLDLSLHSYQRQAGEIYLRTLYRQLPLTLVSYVSNDQISRFTPTKGRQAR